MSALRCFITSKAKLKRKTNGQGKKRAIKISHLSLTQTHGTVHERAYPF